MTSQKATDVDAKMNEMQRLLQELRKEQDDLKKKVEDMESSSNEKKHFDKETTKSKTENMHFNKKSGKIPPHGRLIKSIDELEEKSKKFVHVAVETSPGIFDEYIFMGSRDKENKERYKCFRMQTPEKDARKLEDKDFEQAIIDERAFTIEAPDYPKTEKEKEDVQNRFWDKIKIFAEEYILNPARAMSWLITGLYDVLKDIWDVLFDLHHCLKDPFLRNVLRAAGCAFAAKKVSLFMQAAATSVVVEARRAIPYVGPLCPTKEIPVDCFTKTICKSAGKQMGGKCTTKHVLASKGCTNVAKKAGTEALKNSAMKNLCVTGIIEGGIAIYTISELRKMKDKGIITEEEYARQTAKTVSGALGATAGSVGAGMVGQMVCPIPVVGYVLGSVVGGVCGNMIGSELSG
nr:uncharacterized protein LOC111129471 isoform X2 [Crassostrea virginica]